MIAANARDQIWQRRKEARHRVYARRVTSLLERLGRIGADPNDDQETRQRKALLVYLAILILPISLVWGSLYLALGAVSGVVAYGYFAVSVASRRFSP